MVTVGGVYHGFVRSRAVDDLVFVFLSIRNGNAFSQLNQLLYSYPLGWEKAYTVNYCSPGKALAGYATNHSILRNA